MRNETSLIGDGTVLIRNEAFPVSEVVKSIGYTIKKKDPWHFLKKME